MTREAGSPSGQVGVRVGVRVGLGVGVGLGLRVGITSRSRALPLIAVFMSISSPLLIVLRWCTKPMVRSASDCRGSEPSCGISCDINPETSKRSTSASVSPHHVLISVAVSPFPMMLQGWPATHRLRLCCGMGRKMKGIVAASHLGPRFAHTRTHMQTCTLDG